VSAYRIRVGRRIGSEALVADGLHARTDALTSLAVVVSAVATAIGFDRADAVIGLVIVGAIVVTLVQAARSVLHRALDGTEESTITLIETVAAPGEIQPQKKVQISAKVAAPIVKLPHKEGDEIKKGELLVRLDNQDLLAVKRQVVAQREAQEQQIEVARQRIAGQEATIRASRAMWADLKRDFERNKSLVDTHDVSQAVLDTAQSKFEEQKEQIDSAASEVK